MVGAQTLKGGDSHVAGSAPDISERIDMIFRRPSNHYGISPVPVTPHQRETQVWDDRIGSARVQAKNWRLAFFGTLLLSGGLASALVWQSLRGTIKIGRAHV